MSDIIGKLPTRSEFSQQVDSVFRASMADGSMIPMRLSRFDEHVVNATQENYSLLFQAPVDAPAVQNTYRLDHDVLGKMDLFLVPVKKDEDGLYYEAVFNQLVGS